MTDYKLVSVEPTPEMVEAAEEAYMPFGDMDLALRMAILAAPVVQGELDVEYGPTPGCKQCEEAMSINLDSCPECEAEFCAPQPAEQKPVPDVTQLVEALEASTHRLHEQADGEDDCRCGQCRFVRLRDAALAELEKRNG